jgi:aspartyl-tRNA(Asn)/glutamyl-tRNA(Gln) amidotransferase subunit C
MIDSEGIRKLAKLARIRVSPEEAAEFVPQLAAVLGHVHSLEKANAVASPGPASGVHGATPLREDEPAAAAPVDATSDLVSLSPGHMNGYFEVPQVVPQ